MITIMAYDGDAGQYFQSKFTVLNLAEINNHLGTEDYELMCYVEGDHQFFDHEGTLLPYREL